MHRAYDPTHARWLNRDPIGEAGGVNLYGYVGGDPTTLTDPSGLLFGFNAGEGYADSAVDYWANLQAQTGNPLYAIPGTLAEMWTPCHSNQTAVGLAAASGLAVLGRVVAAAANPDLASIIGRIAQQKADMGFEGLSQYMTQAEIDSALTNPGLTNAYMGSAVQRATAQTLGSMFPDFVNFATGPFDFLFTGTGEVFELTTYGQAAAHAGRGATLILYGF
jgi:uncharacterized protein RhaS with RHS repeats